MMIMTTATGLRALPDDLIVRMAPSGREMTAGQILALPSAVTGVLDGLEPAGGSQDGAFRLEHGWAQGMAGKGFEDICADVAVLAGHAASLLPSWPGTEVHVRALPLTDFVFRYECCPAPVTASLPPRRSA